MVISPHCMVMPRQIGASRPHTPTYVRDSISGGSYNAMTDGSHLVSSFTIADLLSAAGRASRQTRVRCCVALLKLQVCEVDVASHLIERNATKMRNDAGNLNETDQS